MRPTKPSEAMFDIFFCCAPSRPERQVHVVPSNCSTRQPGLHERRARQQVINLLRILVLRCSPFVTREGSKDSFRLVCANHAKIVPLNSSQVHCSVKIVNNALAVRWFTRLPLEQPGRPRWVPLSKMRHQSRKPSPLRLLSESCRISSLPRSPNSSGMEPAQAVDRTQWGWRCVEQGVGPAAGFMNIGSACAKKGATSDPMTSYIDGCLCRTKPPAKDMGSLQKRAYR